MVRLVLTRFHFSKKFPSITQTIVSNMLPMLIKNIEVDNPLMRTISEMKYKLEIFFLKILISYPVSPPLF